MTSVNSDELPVINEQRTSDNSSVYQFEDNPEKKKNIEIDEVYKHLGFSAVTTLIVTISSVGFFLLGMSLLWLSLMLVYFDCKEHIKDAAVVGVISGFVIGLIISLLIGGVVADKIGRLKVAIFGLYVVVLAWVASIISYILFAVSFFVVGIGLGCVLPSTTIYGFEYTGKSQHTRVMLIQFGFYLTGSIYAILLFYFLESLLSWRIIALLLILPAIPVIPFFHLNADSPKFYAVSGRRDKAYLILFNLHHSQNRAMIRGNLQCREVRSRGGCCDPYSKGFSLTTTLLSIVYFFVYTAYYSLNYGLVISMSHSGYCGNSGNASRCHDNNAAMFYKGLFSIVSDILGLILAVFLAELLGYRRSMLGLAAVSGVATLSALYCFGYIVVTVELGLARACIFAVVCILTIYTLEVYTTNMRAVAFGQLLSSGLSGLWVAAFLSNEAGSITVLLIYIGVCILINLIPMYFLPVTSGLEDIDSEGTLGEQTELVSE